MNRYSNNWHVKRGFVQDLSLIGRILILLPWPDLYIKCINQYFIYGLDSSSCRQTAGLKGEAYLSHLVRFNPGSRAK